MLKKFEESAKLSCGADNGVCELRAKKNFLQIIRNCRRARFPVLREFAISIASFPNGFCKFHFFESLRKTGKRRVKTDKKTGVSQIVRFYLPSLAMRCVWLFQSRRAGAKKDGRICAAALKFLSSESNRDGCPPATRYWRDRGS
ncbi:MAG: hypothetical protein DBX55_00500 [Verrucomicrobia bacterium]|nr:MAG: hypothetical protein DBX55_00500 [Verrucomicrobiota bacterium]